MFGWSSSKNGQTNMHGEERIGCLSDAVNATHAVEPYLKLKKNFEILWEGDRANCELQNKKNQPPRLSPAGRTTVLSYYQPPSPKKLRIQKFFPF